MLTPAIRASSTSAPCVIIVNAFCTHVMSPPFLNLLPLAEAITTGNEKIFKVGKHAKLEAEAVAIRRALEETRWNRKEAARRLQMSYKTFLNRLKLLEAGGQSI